MPDESAAFKDVIEKTIAATSETLANYVEEPGMFEINDTIVKNINDHSLFSFEPVQHVTKSLQ